MRGFSVRGTRGFPVRGTRVFSVRGTRGFSGGGEGQGFRGSDSGVRSFLLWVTRKLIPAMATLEYEIFSG